MSEAKDSKDMVETLTREPQTGDLASASSGSVPDAEATVAIPRSMDQREFAVAMGFEAFRVCVGQPTKNYPPDEVFRWMQTMLKARGE